MYEVVMGVAPGDERAEDKAEAVADLPRAPGSVSVTVVHAADVADPTSVASVAETVDFFEERDIEATATTVDAEPTDAVLSTAAERDADLVVVAGRRRSPAGKLQMNTGAQQVVLQADRPVLVAGQPDG